MPLTAFTFSAAAQFTEAATQSGFAQSTNGPNNPTYSLLNLNLNTFNQAYSAQLTIAAGAHNEFSLQGFANLVAETVTLQHALFGLFLPSASLSGAGAQCQVGPGVTNGFTAWWGGTTPVNNVPIGGCLALGHPATDTGDPVTPTADTIRITNPGTGTLVVTVLILGSTT